MNKKGAELPLNVVVVAVLVIMVLVVVVIFFLGGMGGMTSKVKSMFFGTMAGTDRSIAVQTCQTRCEQARLLSQAGTVPTLSAYCKDPFYIDNDNNGEADKTSDEKYIKFFCWPWASGSGDLEQSLNVGCALDGKQINCAKYGLA